MLLSLTPGWAVSRYVSKTPVYHRCGQINNANLYWFSLLPLFCLCFPPVPHPFFLESLPK